MRRSKAENEEVVVDENFLTENENYLPQKQTVALQRRRSTRLFKAHNNGDVVNMNDETWRTSVFGKTKRLRHSFNNNSCKSSSLNSNKV